MRKLFLRTKREKALSRHFVRPEDQHRSRYLSKEYAGVVRFMDQYGYGIRRSGKMEKRKNFTVLSLLEPNRGGRTILRPKPARWFNRRNAALSEKLLASAVQWPIGLTGVPRKILLQTSF